MDPNWNDSQPIFLQIRQQLIEMILRGTIPEGEPLLECRERLVNALCKALDKCKAPEGKRIAVVLRPFAMALLVDWLRGEDQRLVVSEIRAGLQSAGISPAHIHAETFGPTA